MPFVRDANSTTVHGANPADVFDAHNLITVCGEDNPITVCGEDSPITVYGADHISICGADSITCAARAIPSPPDSNTRRKRATHLQHQPTQPALRCRDQPVVLRLLSPVHSYHKKPAPAPVRTRREPILTVRPGTADDSRQTRGGAIRVQGTILAESPLICPGISSKRVNFCPKHWLLSHLGLY